ncbi:MAG: bifunctional acetate--CoA ligase family protein/GNAT family N-acetyltransferase [Rhizobiales bacterium]|nr:bifunctional acetate--CoA ligase family protein/GNAT family N-acetyltransferase [Hyphomicrobiales bacterium]MBN9010735.1 bifunctional acetate--CoA ligase family protein/GNAT family N-acetyltransferase [Hyphomicrobiales bacterium]
MSIRNFDSLFEPKAIALVGASNRPHAVGAVVARNLLDAGFDGPVLFVNPHEASIRSTLNYRSVSELPVTPDLAVIATPAATVPGLIADLGARGCRAAIVLAAGFGEGDQAGGAALRDQMLAAARPHLLRIVGPNCLGVISTGRRINASFAPSAPPPGEVALVTQSGAIATALLDWGAANGIGFSHVVSLGDMADVDFGDMLDYLALDRKTRAIMLYVENVTSARKFMSAGRIAARVKPVILVKSGRSTGAAKAARSHTGALAGSDIVYDAAFRRAGMLRVFELRELLQALASLSFGLRPEGYRLAILTNGGGAGVIAVDALEKEGGKLSELSKGGLSALDAVLPPSWSHGNPVDILGDAGGDRYGKAYAVLEAEPAKDAILVINCPTAVADSDESASAVAEVVGQPPKVATLTCWLGGTSAVSPRRRFAESGIPSYETPEEAVRAFMHMVRYRRNQNLLLETPSAPTGVEADRAAIRGVIARVRAASRQMLTEVEAKEVLAACGIPVVETRVAATPAAAAAMARDLKGPIALKILSPDISHKSDVGGVQLGLDASTVAGAAEAMLATVRGGAPEARIDGLVVEPMIVRPNAWELLAGIAHDSIFGPVVLFGQGGTSTEVVADRAIGLPPLNSVLARELISRTRVARVLAGYRDRPPADLAAIADVLIRLAQLAADFPEIAELDINPLLADAGGVVALDARILLGDGPSMPPAIAPYPATLAYGVTTSDGLAVFLRPIRPDDEPLLADMVRRSDPADVRLRFLLHGVRFSDTMAARLSQIDYDREMAFVALASESGAPELLGVGRLVADPENEKAEFAVMVRSDLKGRGLGYCLMQELVAHARRRGLKVLHGEVLRENRTMLQLASELGFVTTATEAPNVVEVRLDIT